MQPAGASMGVQIACQRHLQHTITGLTFGLQTPTAQKNFELI